MKYILAILFGVCLGWAGHGITSGWYWVLGAIYLANLWIAEASND